MCLWLFFVYFFPSFYFSELVLSFLPYIVFFCLFMFVISLLLCKNKKIWKHAKIMPLFVLLFGLLFFLFSKEFNRFYNGEGFENLSNTKTESQSGLNILYSNILYKNLNDTALLKWIWEHDADIVMMVEFTDEHYQKMKDLLHNQYPYSARTSWSQKYFWNVVFSKYPINNLMENVDQWTWRYSYFHTEYNWQNYYFYLVHTSSPVSYKFFQMRNNHFDVLIKDYLEHSGQKTEKDRVMILWDFNVSPWSIYYKNLEKSLEWLTNLTKNFTISFTWRIMNLPFVTSHIDHIFVDGNSSLDNLTRTKTPNSDHRWFFIENFR